ncbi:citrate/2-methylcitrate synthase [Microbacterium oleivorans]|uniref:citrate synthase (unknown stereospecificity) n=1 Tax=Microbacterium oleivorans TaxID=273677 RepID=A0A7D5JDG9_9MICO|nr:citrate/2-methylcitrate synthase [Microbacterium oleivorans]QLD11880.1 hypothetical protein HW566_08940 [Microbacterium oleivorans]
MTEPPPRLSAAQVAARLEVRIETVYAYVSRGMLRRSRDRAGSWFDPLDVEAFAVARRRRSRSTLPPPRGRSGAPLMVVDTDVAHIDDGELFYRERSLEELSHGTFEDAVSWLWQAPPPSWHASASEAAGLAATAASSLPPESALIDRVRVAVATLGAHDVLRHQAGSDNLHRIGWALLRALPHALDPSVRPTTSSIAEAIACSLTTTSDPTVTRAVDLALTLMIDHDLAASTFVARVAASARADGYSIVQAALGAFDSPLHGGAPRAAARLVARVVQGSSAAAAVAEAAQLTGSVPGFGQPLYDGIDPRAAALLPLIPALPQGAGVAAAVDELAAVVSARTGLMPNSDLALAALGVAAGMPEDGGVAIFALGRTAGWIRHAAAEYDERPLRLRPRGNYVGP